MPDVEKVHVFVFRDTQIDQLSEWEVAAAVGGGFFVERKACLSVTPHVLQVNSGVFACKQAAGGGEVMVGVVQEARQLTVSSDRPGAADRLSPAEAIVLAAILYREELGVFFHPLRREQYLRRAAAVYGLEHEPDLSRYLSPVFADGRLSVQPCLQGLISPVSPRLQELAEHAARHHSLPRVTAGTDRMTVVITRHKYYRNPVITLIDAQRTKSGKLKPPFSNIQPLERAVAAADVGEARFYAAVAKLQQVMDGDRTASDLEALCAALTHGAGYPFYYHDDSLSENLTVNALLPVRVARAPDTACLSVQAEGAFYAITGKIDIDGMLYSLHELPLKCGYFLQLKDTLYLIDNALLLSTIALLKAHAGKLLIHAGKYREFQQRVLDKLADNIRVTYPDIRPGDARQLAEAGFSAPPKRLLYLSDFGDHVMIIPVVRYGEAEVAIRTERQLKGIDSEGNNFLVPRDADLEQAFIALLIKQHPYLPEQLENQLYYFYLHKRHFLAEEWFLAAFDKWYEDGIEVYGFNELTDNKITCQRVAVDIKVTSGLNWFNATYNIRFGRKKTSLRKMAAALRNKRRYVVLDDGTMGILPETWIEKFTAYFQAGEVVDDETLRIAKVNFEKVSAWYDTAVLDEGATLEISKLTEHLKQVESIAPRDAPASLKVSLRPYQRKGLGWLHFLDDVGFGGILADEMGLGKTVQIIAFMLSQREAGRTGTDLVVVPATLIFNWQRELHTLAPSLAVFTLYGPGRAKTATGLGQYDVVLTSYIALLADIRFLKTFAFNYVYLDESQNIKNPESQRYKAVRLLQARNRIAISGTPFENSSFDLYGQLSFACPALLGDKRYFRDVYGRPIDQFNNKKRRLELQRLIQPFILRRTKQEVARELPEKVTAILYSEMGEHQRRIYEAYEKEFRDFICALSGEELDKQAMHVLRGLTRLRQICNSPALLPDGMLNDRVSGKLELLQEQLQDKTPHHKVVVFSQFVSMLHLIGDMLDGIGIRHVSLTGSTRLREQVVNAFQEDPEIRVFLISLKAGGTGLNLTAADVVYLVDPWWNPAAERQAIDRVHRIGQQRKVMAYRLVTPGTVEEKVLQLQATKSALADGLVGGDTPFGQLLGSLRAAFL